jgi:ribosome hibernation promoting factor
MQFRVSGRNIDVGEALRARINARIAEATAKYFDGGFSGHVTIGKDGFGFRTECVIHLDSGIVLEADALAADAYASADRAAMHIEKRLRRYKRRLKDHQAATRGNGYDRGAEAPDEAAPGSGAIESAAINAPSYVIAAPEHDSDEEVTEWNPVIIAESTTALKRLSVSEAVMELDMTGVPVIVFRHAGHGRVNLIYRRADGHIGWIDPPAVDANAN